MMDRNAKLSATIVSCVLAAGIAAVAWRAFAAERGAPGKPAELLILADEPEPMAALAEFLRGEAGYKVRYVDSKDAPPDLSPFAAVLMYIHRPIRPDVEKAMIAYTNAGGRMLVLHHGLASAKMRNPAWMRLAGMYIAPRNDPNHPWRVIDETTHTLVNLRPGHYITSHKVKYDREVEYVSSDAPSRPAKLPALDFKNTEVFLNQHFTDGRAKTVLFGFRCEREGGGKAIMQDRGGWYKRAGRGWLFYLQPGHTASDFRNPNYRQIIRNCLTWRPGLEPAAPE